MKKTIIFDFDGTIADTFELHYSKVKEIVSKLHLGNMTDQEVVEEIRSKTPQELVTDFKISWIKLPFIFSTIKQAQKKLISYIDKIPVYPGIKATLNNLKKKYQLGILSSNLKVNIDKFLLLNNLEIFNFVHCENNIFGKDKALNNLAKKHSLLKNNIYYVGDEVRDIEACHKAGIKMIAVGWGLHNKKLLLKNNPDYFVEKPEGIMHILVGEERVELS